MVTLKANRVNSWHPVLYGYWRPLNPNLLYAQLKKMADDGSKLRNRKSKMAATRELESRSVYVHLHYLLMLETSIKCAFVGFTYGQSIVIMF